MPAHERCDVFAVRMLCTIFISGPTYCLCAPTPHAVGRVFIAASMDSDWRRRPRTRTGLDIRGTQIDEATQALLYVSHERRELQEIWLESRSLASQRQSQNRIHPTRGPNSALRRRGTTAGVRGETHLGSEGCAPRTARSTSAGALLLRTVLLSAVGLLSLLVRNSSVLF